MKHDCVIFVESWIKNVCLNILYTYSKPAIKGRHSIVVVIKEWLTKGVTILHNDDNFDV